MKKDTTFDLLIEKLERKYISYNINIEEINEIVTKVINDSIELDYADIKLEIEKNLSIIAITKLKEEPLIISKFIDQNIKLSNNRSKNQKELCKLVKLFNNISYIPDVDEIINIIENNKKINNLLKIIVNNYKTIENKVNISNISEDFITSSFLSTYCLINSIDIIDEYEDFELDEVGSIEGNESLDVEKAYINSIPKRKKLTREEEKEYIVKIKNGDMKARDEFIISNLLLVVYIAKRYSTYTIDVIDLISEGNLGLFKAVERFDSSRGCKFSSYATEWIKSYIRRAIRNKNRSLRLPGDLEIEIFRYNREVAKLSSELNRVPTKDEIMKSLGWSEKKFEKIRVYMEDAVSYNQKVGDDEEEELINLLSSNKNTEDEFFDINLRDEMIKLINSCGLKKQHIDVLLERYGFVDGIPKKGRELADIMKVSRQRVSFMEQEALKKIRLNGKTKHLAVYTDDEEKSLERLQIMNNENYKKIKSKK